MAHFKLAVEMKPDIGIEGISDAELKLMTIARLHGVMKENNVKAPGVKRGDLVKAIIVRRDLIAKVGDCFSMLQLIASSPCDLSRKESYAACWS